MKYCGRCNKNLPFSSFAKNSVKKDGLQERCKQCRADHFQTVKHNRPKVTKEKKRKYVLASYGLTVIQFENMLADQNNCCAICYTKDWGKPSPSVDHCHSTNAVRGLLCNMCNRALGMFKDNIEVLENAAKYIKRSRPS